MCKVPVLPKKEINGTWQIPTSPQQQVGVPRPGRVGAEFRRKLPLARVPNRPPNFPTQSGPAWPRPARWLGWLPPPGLRAIGNKPSRMPSPPRKKFEKKNEKKTPEQKKAHALRKRGNRGSPPLPPTRGEERNVRRHADASSLPPPLLSSPSPAPQGSVRFGCVPARRHRTAARRRTVLGFWWGVGRGVQRSAAA